MARTPLYDHLEEQFAFLIAIVIKVGIVLTSLFFGVAFFIPISYGIFGYPEPDQWFRMYEF